MAPRSPSRLVWAAAALVVILLAGWWFWSRSAGPTTVAFDLVDGFPSAEKRSNGNPEVTLATGSFRLRGDVKRGIYMHPTSRLTYRGVVIPERASLHAFVGLREEAWDKSNDGVLFRVGLAADGQYIHLAQQHVDPLRTPDHRRWVEVNADLSAYAGRTVDLILNTNASLPGHGNDGGSDFGVWGEPAIVVPR